jgi:hypothetical protein
MFFVRAMIWLSSARNSMISFLDDSFLDVMALEKVPLVFMSIYL